MKKAAAKNSKGGKGNDIPAVPSEFVPVVEAFAKTRDVTLGKMFSAKSVLQVNGKIFAMHVRGKFVAKLPRDRVDGLVSTGKGEKFDPGQGRLMKEWIAIESGKGAWVGLAKEAYAFVKTCHE